ncbi:MAG: EF-hand domain-containing protein [Planctomycetota bacterium]
MIIKGHSPQQILALFGFKGVKGASESRRANYRRSFGFTDTNRDGKHSRKEYVENGRYMTPQARAGIFQASDSNKDDVVSEDEYIDNRIITDEAKEIFSSMDGNKDNKLTAKELLSSKKIEDEQLAGEIFKALDTNSDGSLVIPEYLRVWGRWARS